jgi:hypothetical protein
VLLAFVPGGTVSSCALVRQECRARPGTKQVVRQINDHTDPRRRHGLTGSKDQLIPAAA